MYDDFDMMAEQHLWPWIDDPSLDCENEDNYDGYCEDYMTDVEADADTFKSCGWGTDEDYGYYGDE
jgi:hypothetical protein